MSIELIGDHLICDISLKEDSSSGIIRLNRDPRKMDRKADCYFGKVEAVGPRCRLVKVGDEVVFVRWVYAQFDIDDARIGLREVDLVVVNDKCVNGHCAVNLYDPFEKKLDLYVPESKADEPKYVLGQIFDIDNSFQHTCPTCSKKGLSEDTQELVPGDVVKINKLSDYQYRIGKHTLVFKNIYDVVDAKIMHISLQRKELAHV